MHPVWLHSSKEGLDHIVKNCLGSNLDDLLWFRPDASDLEARWCTRIIRPGSGRIQPVFYQFLTFRLGCVLPRTAQIILCQTSLDPIWFCQVWTNGSGLEASRCAKITGPASGFCTIQYNTTLLSLCREIYFLARHLHKKHSIQLTIKHQQLSKTRS